MSVTFTFPASRYFFPLQKSFCFNLEQEQTLDNNNNDPETWIASPYKKDISVIDRKLDRSSFFAIAALKRIPTTRRKSSLLEQHSSCIDPSASEEHDIEEYTSFNNNTSFPLPARSLFSAHEEVIFAFSAGQRRLQQCMSQQQRRASIAEAQRERASHMEILEQHFGRRFLRKALTIVEENDKLLAAKVEEAEGRAPTGVANDQPVGVTMPQPQEGFLDSLSGNPPTYEFYKNNNEHLINNTHAKSFAPTTGTPSSTCPAAATSFTLSFEEEPVVEEESDFYIELNTLYGSSSSFSHHAEFSIGARSTTEGLETVALF